MKPDWDKLMEEFSGSATQLIGDVDCTADGKPLCDANGVRGYPTIKYGDPSDLQDYQGGRTAKDIVKGAMRELRKDALFIARQRQAEEDKTSDYLEARGKRSMSIMQDQEANWKSMKREKSGRGVKPKKEPGASI